MGGRGREGGETDGEVWRLRYEISSSGGFTHTSHTLRSHTAGKKKRRAQSNCKAVNPRTILKVLRCFISCWSGRVSVCECVSVSYRRDSE